ncbi:MAG: PEP-CTERM sorting domain-containing protein [Planctomycetota bacterium]
MVVATPTAIARPPVYFHYMPWFETPASNGGEWGYHWQFLNRDPSQVDAQGRRDIASHYYPKIGPYASGDPNVLEYHLLLTKLSGAEGLLLDWYGVAGSNGDIASLLANSNAIFDKAAQFGLDVGVVLEDRFARSPADVQANINYLRQNYFNQPHYLRVGPGDDPLLMIFGPIGMEDPAAWSSILPTAGEPITTLPLWYQSPDVGPLSDGEFAWIFEDESLDDHLQQQQTFLNDIARTLGTAAGVAYAGFNDFYAEGGVGDIIGFDIPVSRDTLAATFDVIDLAGDDVDLVQLATFNDFGEGTMFEPTVEFGYDFLSEVQQFTGVDLGEDALAMAFELYSLRVAFGDRPEVAVLLDDASTALSAFDLIAARQALDAAVGLPGDANRDGVVDLADFGNLRSNFGLFVADYSRGDFNADGVVDLQDFGLLRANFGGDAAALDAWSSTVPEPTSSLLVLAAGCVALRRRK